LHRPDNLLLPERAIGMLLNLRNSFTDSPSKFVVRYSHSVQFTLSLPAFHLDGQEKPAALHTQPQLWAMLLKR
jgi:hypothetical protein